MIPRWVARYVGIPYVYGGLKLEGADCWGVHCIVYREQYGILLPTFAQELEQSDEDREDIEGLVRGESANWIPIDEPREGDAILSRFRGQLIHVSIVLDAVSMLSTFPRANSHIVNYRGNAWRTKIEGFYRHPALMS